MDGESNIVLVRDVKARFGISGCTAQLWAKNGQIERFKIMDEKTNRELFAFFADDLAERAALSRKQGKTVITMIDGVRMFRCTGCLQSLPEDRFDRTGRRAHGIPAARCKDCRNITRQRWITANPHKKNEYAERLKKKRRDWTKMAVAAQKNQSNATVKAADALAILKDIRPNEDWAAWSQEIGIHPDRIRNGIVRQAKRERSIHIASLDYILSRTGHIDKMQHLVVDTGIASRWHEKWDYCQQCFRTSVAHSARGLCTTCYQRRNTPDYVPMVDNRWSQRYTKCVSCGQTSSKHAAKGVCSRCSQRNIRQLRKAMLVQ